MVTLREVQLPVGEAGLDGCVFDTLGGDHDHAEFVGELDGAAVDSRGPRIGAQTGEEAAVELELVDGQPAQVGQ